MVDIASYRAIAGLTMANIAERMGVSTGTVNRWERGQPMRDHQIVDYLAACGVTDATVIGAVVKARAGGGGK